MIKIAIFCVKFILHYAKSDKNNIHKIHGAIVVTDCFCFIVANYVRDFSFSSVAAKNCKIFQIKMNLRLLSKWICESRKKILSNNLVITRVEK